MTWLALYLYAIGAVPALSLNWHLSAKQHTDLLPVLVNGLGWPVMVPYGCLAAMLATRVHARAIRRFPRFHRLTPRAPARPQSLSSRPK